MRNVDAVPMMTRAASFQAGGVVPGWWRRSGLAAMRRKRATMRRKGAAMRRKRKPGAVLVAVRAQKSGVEYDTRDLSEATDGRLGRTRVSS